MALKAYSLARDGALHLTPHFRVREFACRDGSDPIFVEEELATLLEAINTAIDDLRADGTLKELSEKYFGQDISAEN